MGWAVRFEEVSKRYSRGGARYSSLRDLVKPPWRWGGQPRGPLALDRVSFEVAEGESLGIIGPNGAGKTTALKLISRISYPTGGRISVRGRVGALIEVGSGIHPELTGRENIWLYGQILGMSRQEIARRFAEIVEFAELPDFIDTQVKYYSSGMQLRLGFAIASHLEPDVFIVDEALAVGDAGFQARCVERMKDLVRSGSTMILVSHQLAAVEAVCDRALFLEAGKVRFQGSAKETLRVYLDSVEEQRLRRATPSAVPAGSYPIEIVGVTCHGLDGGERYHFVTGEGMEIRFRLRARDPVRRPHLNLAVTDGQNGWLFHCSMLLDGHILESVEGEKVIGCCIGSLPLLPRIYEVWSDIYSREGYGLLTPWRRVASFRMTEPGRGSGNGPLAEVLGRSLTGPILVAHEWHILERERVDRRKGATPELG